MLGDPQAPIPAATRKANAQVELWIVDLAAAAAGLDALERTCPRLPVDAEQDMERLRDPGQASNRRAAHVALRLLIERRHGEQIRQQPFVLSPSGKPSLPGLPGDFSLSHSGPEALIGFCETGPIGVDLEHPRRLTMSPQRRERLAAVATMLARGDPLPHCDPERTLQAWVRLEAVAKADGRGIVLTMGTLGLLGQRRSGEEVAQRATQWRAEHPNLTVHDIAAGPGRHAAVSMSAALPLPALQILPTSAPDIASLLP